MPFFVKKELYHRHHHLATLVSTIYLCNPYPELGYAVSPFTPEQVKANVYLHEKLVTDHNLNPKNILGHAEWAPGRKIDPSPYYDWRALATAADKYEDVDHNFGLYPTDVTLKGDPEVVASYKQTASSADVEQIQKQLEELGYSVLSPDEENLGNPSYG